MRLDDLLKDMRANNISIGLNDGKLKVFDPEKNLTDEMLYALKGYRQTLIDMLSEGKGFTESDFPNARLSGTEVAKLQVQYPLLENLYIATPMQQGMLFHGLLDGTGESYTSQNYCDLLHDIDIESFKKAWETVISRHAIFRTCFVGLETRQVHQLVLSEVELPFVFLDWRSVPEHEQIARIAALRREDKCKGFNFAKPPLMRVTLVCLSRDKYHMLWSHHHVLTDGWCTPIILREVLQIYGALEQHKTPHLSHPVAYSQYIDWLIGQDKDRAIQFWTQELEGITRATPLYPHRSYQLDDRQSLHAVESLSVSDVGQHQLILSETITAQLHQLAQRNETTLNTVFQVAWAYLLYRYSGDNTVLFGTTVSGRPAELNGVEEMIGLFINTLPVKVDFDDPISLAEQLVAQHNNNLSRDEFSYLALSDIQRIFNESHRDLKSSSLFDTIIVFENLPSDEWLEQSLEQMRVANIGSQEQTNYGLTMTVYSMNQLTVNFSYSLEYVSAGDIDYIGLHLEQILRAMAVAEDEHVIQQIPMLSRQEQQQQLEDWRREFQTIHVSECIHERFERHAAKTPTAVAVTYEENGERVELNYETLNRRANQLAHYLRQNGVVPNTLVGVCVERSTDMIVALLGVLKAGGAYLPLDPDYPKARLHYMVSDSGVKRIIGCAKAVPLFEELAVEVTQLTSQRVLAAFPEHNPLLADVGVSPGDLAYVIYTSGSTGKPKGVMIEHRNVMRLFASTDAQFGFHRDDVWSLFHSYAFDFSVWEIWGALLYGARLVVVSFEASRTPEMFTKLVIEEGVTILNQTPSAFYSVSDAMVKTHARHQLRYIIFGGEALDFGRLVEWFRFYSSQTQLVNMYGITETTVHATLFKIPPKPTQSTFSCIGKPLSDLTMLVVNRDQQLQPVGVPGELLIAGGGVARGYLHRDELTAKRFVELPFPPCSTEKATDNATTQRFYRTGDLVSWLPNGELAYHGRIDQQVKIRGFRIELGEIEVQLKLVDWLKDAVVCVREDQSKTQRIVGYVVFKAGATIADDWVTLLRDHLKNRLPNYMIPSAFIELTRLPMTVNGKLDVRGLPAPNFQQQSRMNYVPPENELQAQLCGLWQSVLRIKRVGINDNYFAIGGDSILSIQIIAQAKKAGLNLTVKQLFEAQTIEKLAEILSNQSDSHVMQEMVTCEPFELLTHAEKGWIAGNEAIADRVEDAYPLSQLQSGMVYHSQLTPESAVYHDVFSYYIEGPWNQNAFAQVLKYLFAQHEILRTGFHLTGERALQVVYRDIELPFDVFDLRDKSEPEQRRILAEWHDKERFSRFEWLEGPLLRIVIFRRRQNRFQYGFSFHHAILDGWSVARFNQQLAHLYGEAIEGSELPEAEALPPFREYIKTEQQELSRREAKQYWLSVLDGVSVSCLPKFQTSVSQESPLNNLTIAESGMPTYNTPSISTRVSDETCRAYLVHPFSQVSDQILNLSRQLSIPVQYILLASHVKVLSLVSGESDVLTCVVNNARMERDGGDKALGLFLNSLPFRWQGKSGSWRELINQVNQTWVDNLQYRHYPLSEIQRFTGLTLSEAVFNYTHFHAYSDMLAKGQFKVLGVDAFEQTNFSFCASFNRRVNDDSLSLTLLYNPQKVDVSLIQRMSTYYVNTMKAMLADINGSHFSTPLLSRAEQRLLLSEWNHNQLAELHENTVHELVERQVATYTDRMALSDKQDSMTYIDMEKRANQLARHLQCCGVAVGDVVGICLSRSIESIIAVLAVLKAGAAYVPLDPSYPTARLLHMLEDSRMTVFLTESSLSERVNEGTVAKILLDTRETRSRLTQYSTELPELSRPVNSKDLAWVIYTSGTTGVPKGVMVTHRGALNLALGLRTLFNVKPEDNVLHYLSLSFDAATLEWMMALTSGACLHVAGQEERDSPDALGEFLLERQITHTSLPPAIMPYLPLRYDYALKALLLGGESCDQATAWRWASYYPLYNMYGPTEATICVSSSPIKPNVPLMLGRPFPNTSFYVLDENQQLLPVGAVGELYIGGPGVADGYLHRQELSRERFVRNPFSPQRAERLYRTGDKVRYLEDGNLVFEGRVDDQVKIRGFRIELGEISSKLSAIEDVQEALVLVQGEGADQKLVAYVVPHNQDLVNLPEEIAGEASNVIYQDKQYLLKTLHETLKQQLPDYMLPSAYILLKNMPLSPNGKVAHKQLPTPQDHEFVKPVYVKPVSELEKNIADIWATVLNVNKIGLQDNFFDLGGHSLLVIKLMSLVNKALNTKATVRDLFNAPTLGEFVTQIEKPPEEIWQPIVGLTRHSFRHYAPNMFFVPGMGVMSAAYQRFADALQPQIRFHVLESKGIDGRQPVHESMQHMLDDFTAAINEYQPEGPVLLAGHSFGGSVAFEIAVALEKAGRETSLMMFDSVFYQSPMDRRRNMALQNDKSDIVEQYLSNVLLPEVSEQLGDEVEHEDVVENWIAGAKAVAREQMGYFYQYQPSGMLRGRLRLFEARESSVMQDSVRTQFEMVQKYQKYCYRPVSIFRVSGGHHSMFNPVHSESIAQLVAKLVLYRS